MRWVLKTKRDPARKNGGLNQLEVLSNRKRGRPLVQGLREVSHALDGRDTESFPSGWTTQEDERLMVKGKMTMDWVLHGVAVLPSSPPSCVTFLIVIHTL